MQTNTIIKKLEKNKILSAILAISLVINGMLLLTHRAEKDIKNYSDYPLLSKRIFTQNPNDVILNFVPLRKAVKEYVFAQGGNLAIYFEYLPSGISIGVNDREEMKLASLSKVPLVMSVLKKVEKGQLHVTDVVTLEKSDLDSKFGTLWKRGDGAHISIKELIEYSLIESDNTAYHALLRFLTPEEVVDVYDNLEIEVISKDTNPMVSPKAYSSIFRSLYLSSYLSEENSSYILEVLTRTNFNDKIPAGIPDTNIKIAHKIGVFHRSDSPEEVFTDCGIVYLPGRPYILCIFTKKSEEEAKKHSKYLSYMIYSYLMMIKGGNN